MLNISASRINNILKCGQQYHLQYEKNIQAFNKSLTMVWGDWVEAYVNAFLSSRTTLETIDFRDTNKLTPVKPNATHLELIKVATFDVFHHQLNWQQEQPAVFTALLAHIKDADAMEDPATIIALNTEAHNHLSAYNYKPKVKEITGVNKKGEFVKSESLFTNQLLRAIESTKTLTESKAFLDFIEDCVSVELQTTLKANLAFRGIDTKVTGFADMLFRKEDGSLVYLDCKYSMHDYLCYNKNTDTQLFLYALVLKQTYPDSPLSMGFLTPNPDEKEAFHMCDMHQLIAKPAYNRVATAVELMNSRLRPAYCGGGAYISNSCLCSYKPYCDYASGKDVKGKESPDN